MKKKVFLTVTALAMLFAACCKQTEENRGADATKPPVEAVTDAPAQVTEGAPQGAEVTDEGKEESSYGLRYSFREEAEAVKDGDFVYFRSSLYYPVFEGEHAEAMNVFVVSLSETFRECLPDARENAKFDYEDSLTVDYVVSIFPEEEEFIVNCLWETEQYITLFVQSISDTGGVHPNVSGRAYVVNVTDGEAEGMENLLGAFGLTADNVISYATEKLRKEHGENLYHYDDAIALEADVQCFVQNNQWYFNDNGLVLFANPYEIAAYAYGMIECEISYEELEQGLKK